MGGGREGTDATLFKGRQKCLSPFFFLSSQLSTSLSFSLTFFWPFLYIYLLLEFCLFILIFFTVIHFYSAYITSTLFIITLFPFPTLSFSASVLAIADFCLFFLHLLVLKTHFRSHLLVMLQVVWHFPLLLSIFKPLLE